MGLTDALAELADPTNDGGRHQLEEETPAAANFTATEIERRMMEKDVLVYVDLDAFPTWSDAYGHVCARTRKARTFEFTKPGSKHPNRSLSNQP